MSPNHPHRSAVCAGCKTVCLRHAMIVWESASAAEPCHFDGRLVCPECESTLVSDEHSNSREHCDCQHCAAAFARHMGVQPDMDAATRYGLRTEALALFGLALLLDAHNLTVDPTPETEKE